MLDALIRIQEQRAAKHRQFYLDWVDTFASKEDSFRQRLKEQLEIWYAKFPAGTKRGHSSRADNIPRANSRRSAPLDDPDVKDDEVVAPYLRLAVLVARAVDLWWSMNGCFCINFSLDLIF